MPHVYRKTSRNFSGINAFYFSTNAPDLYSASRFPFNRIPLHVSLGNVYNPTIIPERKEDHANSANPEKCRPRRNLFLGHLNVECAWRWKWKVICNLTFLAWTASRWKFLMNRFFLVSQSTTVLLNQERADRHVPRFNVIYSIWVSTVNFLALCCSCFWFSRYHHHLVALRKWQSSALCWTPKLSLWGILWDFRPSKCRITLH